MTKFLCTECYGGHVEHKRAMYLKSNGLRMTCMECGERLAKERRHCIVPMAKSNYVVVTDRSLLKGLNKYANT